VPSQQRAVLWVWTDRKLMKWNKTITWWKKIKWNNIIPMGTGEPPKCMEAIKSIKPRFLRSKPGGFHWVTQTLDLLLIYCRFWKKHYYNFPSICFFFSANIYQPSLDQFAPNLARTFPVGCDLCWGLSSKTRSQRPPIFLKNRSFFSHHRVIPCFPSRMTKRRFSSTMPFKCPICQS